MVAVFSDAAVFGDSNLELPSFRSNRSVVEIHTEISSGEDINSNQMEIKIELPLHARYPVCHFSFTILSLFRIVSQ